MSKARELIKQIETGEKIPLSSGVTVTVVPFPAGLWERINDKALQDHPDPVPPKKTIKVVDGFEEIDDLANPEYLALKSQAEAARSNLLGEAVIDLCVKLDLADWEEEIKRLEKYTGAYPSDPEERRVLFLSDFALRTKGDYENVMVSAITQMAVGDKDIGNRLTNFRREMERAADNGTGPSGSTSIERMDLQRPA